MTHRDDQLDELLSAYVDGELTADERAAVEERLRTDPQAAELVSELRAISSAIKSLPRETLGRDLRASIQAELDEVHSDENRHVIPLSEPLDPPRGFYRGFVWTTIAIAAALMIMFLQSRQQVAERDVAAAAKDEASAAQEHTARNSRRREVQDGRLPPTGEMRALGFPRDAAEPATGVGGAVENPGAIAGDAGGEVPNPPAAAPATSSAPEDRDNAVDTLAAQADAPTDAQRSLEVAETESESMAAEVQAQVARSGAATMPPEAELAKGSAHAAVPSSSAASTEKITASDISAIETIELELRAADGVQRFSRLLIESDFRVPAQYPLPANVAQPQAESTDAGRSAVQSYHENQQAAPRRVDEMKGKPVQVVVEGTPAQIEQLVRSYRGQPEAFAEIEGPSSPTRRVSEFHRPEAPSAGGAVLQSAPQARSQTAAVVGEATSSAGSSYGFAWFLPPSDLSKNDARSSSRPEAKVESAERESDVRLGAPIDAPGEAAPFARERSTATRLATERLAEQLQSPPAEGRVRLKFVLRPAPQPTAAAVPAATEQ